MTRRLATLALLLFITQNTNAPLAFAAARRTPQHEGARTVDAGMPARLAAIEKAVEERRRAHGIPGLSLVIVRDDKVILKLGFGVRDRERNLPVTPETLFAIGSATKAFTSMTAVMSADEGKLSLEDSLKKYLPYFKLRDPEADAKASLRDLLSHRTGLDRTDLAMATGALRREELIRVAGLAKPAAGFREKFLYQNVMYTAAGEATARANGKTWEQLVTDKVLKPLGMKATVLTFGEMQKSPDFSYGYDLNSETRETRRLRLLEDFAAAPAGAIISNANDMGEWLRLLTGRGVYRDARLVSEKGFDELINRQISISPVLGYGLGWFLREWHGHKVVDHGGNIEGFNAMVAFMPEKRLGFAMLSNVSYSPFDAEVAEIVWANLLGAPTVQTAANTTPKGEAAPPESSPRELTPAQRELAGSYENERTGKPLEVAVEAGRLMLLSQGLPPRALIEKEKDAFALAGLPEDFSVNFRRDASGKPGGLLIKQPGGEVAFRRTPDLKGAPSVDDLMARVVEALGGETNLRGHHSMLVTASIDFENEGVRGVSTTSAKAPNKLASRTTLYALDKQIGSIFEYFDGTGGGVEASFGTPQAKTGKQLEDARIASDFYAPLNWKSLYKTVALKRISRVGDEDVYVVAKTQENGNTVTDYVSTKSFLVLRRESSVSYGGTALKMLVTEHFSGYRPVEGVLVPFKIVTNNPSEGTAVIVVKEVKFNMEVTDAVFRPARSERPHSEQKGSTN
ncbi:MAG: serine hydrolase domain-containing protein [Pyrinomonadaceae bacterium]